MAFATSNVRAGTVGNLKLIAGDWTGSQGDDNGVITHQAGRTYLADFISQDGTNGPLIQSAPVSVAANPANAGTTIISVGNRKTVTTGRFLIIQA